MSILDLLKGTTLTGEQMVRVSGAIIDELNLMKVELEMLRAAVGGLRDALNAVEPLKLTGREDEVAEFYRKYNKAVMEGWLR